MILSEHDEQYLNRQGLGHLVEALDEKYTSTDSDGSESGTDGCSPIATVEQVEA